MGKQWVRQEAKKNELAEAMEKTQTWAQANRQQVLGGAGVALVLILLGGYFAYQHQWNERTAWDKYSLAQSYAYQGQWDQALASLQILDSQFERARAWGFGALLEGDIRFRQNRFQQAAETYRKILERQTPKDLLPFALSGLGMALEAAGDYKNAIETDRRFLDLYKDHFLAPQTHASQVRCLIAMGHKDEAKSALQQMTLLYPDDVYWSQWAQSRLNPAP